MVLSINDEIYTLEVRIWPCDLKTPRSNSFRDDCKLIISITLINKKLSFFNIYNKITSDNRYEKNLVSK